MRAVAAALLILGLVAAPASATKLIGTDVPRLAQFQRWVDAARVPTPPGKVDIVDGPCPALASATACASSHAKTIYMSSSAGRHELLHELGHLFDSVMPGSARARFLRIVGQSGADWSFSRPAPAEEFADAFALCAVNRRTVPQGFKSKVGYQPTMAQHRAACRLISTVGRALTR